MTVKPARFFLVALFAVLTASPAGFAQDGDFDEFENELMESEGGDLSIPTSEDPGADINGEPRTDSLNFDDMAEPAPQPPTQAYDDNLPTPGSFRKPKGPPGGGVIKAPHPAAARGLLRIQKDGSYLYKTPVPEKTRSTSVRVGYLTSPSIKSVSGVNFTDIYGADGLFGLVGEYEWQPFRRFGSLGLQLGAGVVVARGNGRFATGEIAQEIYNLAVVPLSANLVYRFEYFRRQWVVPFISGGGIAYGLAEIRDDGKTPTFAMAPAVAAGGGLHFSISAWDPQGAFILATDYGLADLWLTVEAKVIQGLDQDLDFTNQTISGGFTVDF